MELSGKTLATPIHKETKSRVDKLISKGVAPKIAIVTVGGEDTWLSYISQKQKTAQRLGIETKIIHLESNQEKKLLKIVSDLNQNKNVHGIIIQRPLPKHFDREKIINIISPLKDIDGFRNDSKHIIPMIQAVESLIKNALKVPVGANLQKVLMGKEITVVGKGETAGKPMIKWLNTFGIIPNVIDSKTENVCKILKKSDIVISGIGKTGIVKATCLKKGVILIGIGLSKENGKLVGDYNQDEVKKIARAYTPTPGGVGPLNLAYLFKNLLDAAEKST